MDKNLKNETICIQGGWTPKNGEPRQVPIYQSTTFKYESTEQMSRLFDLKETGYFYTRLQNPTSDAVAAKIANLEGGAAAMLTSSGQAAVFFAIFNICSAGDHFLATNNIYGGTFNLFNVTLKKMGISCTFIDPLWSDEQIEAAILPNTKCIFGETLSNPGCNVLDLERFATLAHKNGLPLIIDNTLATPINCKPIQWGADIVVHSTTKYLDGHASQVGGCIVDAGTFPWSKYPNRFTELNQPDASYHGIVYTETFGNLAYLIKAVVQLMRDLGASPAPQNAYLLNLGIESLHLRMPRHCENALRIATYLKNHPKVAWVNYPDLPDNKNYPLAKKYLPNGSSGVLCFGLKGDQQTIIQSLDKLKIISIMTHVADSRSCVLHPASHTHRQLTPQQLQEAGIPAELIRLSVGIENIEDLIADLEQALA